MYDLIVSYAGHMRLVQVSWNAKDIRIIFRDGKVPDRSYRLFRMAFDLVLAYEDKKGFDWRIFFCAISDNAVESTRS